MFSDVNRLLDQYIYIILRLQQEQECSGCSLTEVAVEKAAAGEGWKEGYEGVWKGVERDRRERKRSMNLS